MERLDDLVARRARDDSGKPFCFFGGSITSFGELGERVGRLASDLAALGVAAGDRVAVMLANHPDHPAVFLALVRLGVTQVPINIHLRGVGLEYVLRHSEARAIIADARFAPELSTILERTSVSLLVWRPTPVPLGSAGPSASMTWRPRRRPELCAPRRPTTESSPSLTPRARPVRRRARCSARSRT